jgi:soluble lytic murein transglycosylase-like protein
MATLLRLVHLLLTIWLILLLLWSDKASAQTTAQADVQITQPSRAALAQRASLTRIAHASWGLDAPVPLFAAQIHQESGWNAAAVSRAGAIGAAQFIPATAAWWCALNKLSAMECQPTNIAWAMRAMIGYDLWLYQRVHGATELDRWWATLRSYNGGLGHWQKEAAFVPPPADHTRIDAACGHASRSALHCPENLGYPQRILFRHQLMYAGWGRMVGAA